MNRRTFIAILAAALAPLKRLLAKKPKRILGLDQSNGVEWVTNQAWVKAQVEMEIFYHKDSIMRPDSQQQVSEQLTELLNRESKRSLPQGFRFYANMEPYRFEFPKNMGEIK